MKQEIIEKLKSAFEEYSNNLNGIEFWFARDLQKLLDYEEWRNFVNVIEKAKISYEKTQQDINDHFVEVNKKVKIGSETERNIDDFMLTRYACYLIGKKRLK